MALEVFYSYAREDEKLRDRLETHLTLLKRDGLITEWHDRKIGAGDEWHGDINAHVHSAQIILLLVSADFLASEYINDVELKIALDRHALHEAIVIPIILRPVNWSKAPFAKLQGLPRDARPVTSWSDPEEAFADVARGIEAIVNRYRDSLSSSIEGGRPLSEEHRAKSRVLDAAIPSHIVKGVGTQLLVLIRLPESDGLKGTLVEDEEAEAKPKDVRSKPFGVVFPIGPDGRPASLKAAVQIDSPDFFPPRQTKNIFVWPDRDSDTVSFMLTPKRTGRLRVLVELQWEDALQGSRSLRTEFVADASGVPDNSGSNVVRVPLDIGDRAAKPGEFTTFFQGPFQGDRPAEIPGFSSQPIEPPKKSVGEFTALFGKTTPPRPASPASTSVPEPSFTSIFKDMGISQPALNEPPPVHGGVIPAPSQPPPAVPQVNAPSLPDPVFNASTPVVTPTPPVPSTPQLPNPPVERPAVGRSSSLPGDGATGAFMRPAAEPATVPVEAQVGPSSYTQIISHPKDVESDEAAGEPAAAEGGGQFAAPSMPKIPAAAHSPMPKMPPVPKVAPPPVPKMKGPSAPKIPKVDAPAQPPVSMWPLIITLTVLFFLAVIVVLFFVLKH